MLRFHLPLIEPDGRISRIRLSEKVHAFACGGRRASPWLGRAVPPATSEAFREVLGSSPLSFRFLVASGTDPSTQAPSLGGHYPLHRYYGPVRLPPRPGLSLAGLRLATCSASGVGLACCVCLPCQHAVATAPVDPSPLLVLAFDSLECDGGGLPHGSAGSASTSGCFGACSAFTCAQRGIITACWLAESSTDDPFTSKASADSLPPRLFRLLPGGTSNFPGGTCTRWKTTPLHGALSLTPFLVPTASRAPRSTPT